jgi:hypothetical protein
MNAPHSLTTIGEIGMTDRDHDWLAGAMASPEPKPRTYRLVESDSGACPECGRIDHRYLDYDSDGASRVTRTCDEHRLIWAVADLPK